MGGALAPDGIPRARRPPRRTSRGNDSDDATWKTWKWGNNEWKHWSERLRRECEKFWSGRFWLLTPDSYSGIDWPSARPTHRPNVFCRYDLKITDTAHNAHETVQCVRLAGSLRGFRSHATLWSNRDLEREDVGAGKVFKTHHHEVGHLIGLGHSGEYTTACITAPDSNADPCYGVVQPTVSDEARDVMGRGRRREAWHAHPWRKAMAQLTGTVAESWGISMTRVYPRPIEKARRGLW